MLKVWKRGYVLYAAGKMTDNISVDEPCDLNIFSYIFVHFYYSFNDITFYLCFICFNSKILKMTFLNFLLYCMLRLYRPLQENWMEILGMSERGDLETYVQYILY
jgi:hypothetical protein